MRRSALGLVALIALATLTLATQAQETLDWAGDYATYARQDPAGFFTLLGNMPVEEQKAFLMLVGTTLQQKQNLPCNPFGGTESCMTLSSDSQFAQTCPGHDLKVDCAYYSDDLQEVSLDPGKELKELLQSRGLSSLESSCPECFANQKKLWCAQTVPACGTYQQNMVGLLLPAVAQVVAARENGQTQDEALSEVVPPLLQASSLSLPCREMCEAVMSTCSCGNEQSLGSLLKKAFDGLLPNQQLPEGFSRQMFDSLYEQPLCALYASRDTEGFTGRSETLPSHCTRNASWCDNGANPDAQAVQELMALQLTKAMFGWLGSHASGLLADEQALIEGAGLPGELSIENRYARQSGSSNSSRHTAVILGVMLGLVATGCTAALAFVVYTRPDMLAERLPALFGKRQGTGLDAVDYTELQQPSERESLMHG